MQASTAANYKYSKLYFSMVMGGKTASSKVEITIKNSSNEFKRIKEVLLLLHIIRTEA